MASRSQIKYQNNIEYYRKYNRDRYQKKKQQVDTNKNKYRSSAKGRFVIAKSVAKTRKKLWSLSLLEYTQLIAKPCYYCNCDLAQTGTGLDRLDNRFGYYVSNVVPCCRICNQSRLDHFTPDEWKTMIQAVQKYRTEKESK